jgi:hypothetical protein
MASKAFLTSFGLSSDLDAALPAIQEYGSFARDGRVKSDGHTLFLPKGLIPPMW